MKDAEATWKEYGEAVQVSLRESLGEEGYRMHRAIHDICIEDLELPNLVGEDAPTEGEKS